MERESWCTIESDPGVFTELLEAIGVKDVQVEEIYSLSEETFAELHPVYGLIFLFKWRSETDDRPVQPCDTEIFFANQVIENACATQAILSIILNLPDIDIGSELKHFKEFTREFPPKMKGLAISNSELIRNTHNSFARPEPFVYGGPAVIAKPDDDVYHFISYLPIGGTLYELDGLKAGPIDLGPCEEENWLELVKPVIAERGTLFLEHVNGTHIMYCSKLRHLTFSSMKRLYSKSEIRFNLMAIVKRRSAVYQEEKENLEAEKDELEAKKISITEENEEKEVIEKRMAEVEIQLACIDRKLVEEEEKFKNWKTENVRRKHNYIPFIMNMLRILAERGELLPLVEQAKTDQ